jgi:hypothetical protein
VINIVGGGYYEMTKKFWNDWKKRVNETYRIDLFESVEINGEFYNRWNLINHSFVDDKIIKANFNNDSVDLVIERHGWVSSSPSHLHKENLYVTLKRANIKTIEFIKTL